MNECIVEVALPVPLARYFDYRLITDDETQVVVGQRIQVPFGHGGANKKGGARKLIGIITAIKSESEFDESKLKNAIAVLDDEPLLNGSIIKLLIWASQYYHFPPGAVFEAALPALLRKKPELPEKLQEQIWSLTELGRKQFEETLFAKIKKRAPVQAALIELLVHHKAGLKAANLNKELPNWRSAMRALEKKHWSE